MALVGDLGSVDLAQVFQVLSQNQKDGVLDVFRGDVHQGLRFRRGAITLQFDRDVYEERALEMLRRLERVTEEKFRVATTNRHGDASLLDVLVQMKLVDAETVLRLFRERMAEELYELFSWSDARFEFHENVKLLEGVGGEIDERLYFPADAVVMEAARRLDEWNEIRQRVPDDGEVFAPLVEQIVPEDENQGAVFAVVDGARSVAEISKRLGRSIFEASKAVARLVDLGSVAAVPADEYPKRGRGALDGGRPADAANLFDRAAAASVGLPDSIGSAGRAWQAAGEAATAAERFVAYGDALLGSGRAADALTAYGDAHKLVPTHLDAWKKAVFLALELVDAETGPRPASWVSSAENDGQALAEVLVEIGQDELACEVLERIVQRNPKNLDVKRALVNALERHGKGDRLVQLLESISEDLAGSGDVMGAAASLQRALRADSGRKDLLSRIRELYRRDERRRTRKKALTVGITSTALGAAVLLLVVAREQRATAELSTIDVETLVRLGEYESARTRLLDFRSLHPLTLAAARAGEELDRIGVLSDEAQKHETERRLASRKARQERVDEAEGLAKSADEQARTGELRNALRDLRRALAVAPPDWEQASGAQRNARDLENYLRASASLSARWQASLKKNDLAAARRDARELASSYPLSSEAREAKLPYRVRTVPSGATIEVDGAVAGKSPIVVQVPARAKRAVVRASLAGYATVTVDVDPESEEIAEIRLGRAPSGVAELPEAATAGPSMSAGRAFVPIAGGRIAAMGPAMEPLWTTRVTSGGEILAAPLAEKDRLYVGTTDGAVCCVDAAKGEVVWRAEAGSSIRVPIVRSPLGLIAALDDGRVVAVDDRGAIRKEWTGATRPAGGIATSSKHVAIGLSDGRVRLIPIDPTREELALPLGAPVTGIALATERIVAACDDGRVAAFALPSGERLFESAGGRIAHPHPHLVGARLLVELDGKIARADASTGKVAARAELASEPGGPPALAGSRLVVPLRDGSVACLRADDLGIEWTWPGESALANVSADGNAFVAVVGKRCMRFSQRP
ncbi:MAG TPA: DUF4388 domain-containing protein [Planctomycetota bacterium]|nr:DUF4388 domain-containing protein [Planctomycetota bacterium]